MKVAQTILEQLGGNKFIVMTGAKNFIGSSNSLSFRIGQNHRKINAVHIELTPNDLYTVTFKRIRKFEVTDVETIKDVYFDMLQEIFTKVTGMYTRL